MVLEYLPSPDSTPEGADWTKTTWDLPPYKSPEFMEQFPDLDAFRNTTVYNYAVQAGLILDDEWLADFATPVEPEEQ